MGKAIVIGELSNLGGRAICGQFRISRYDRITCLLHLFRYRRQITRVYIPTDRRKAVCGARIEPDTERSAIKANKSASAFITLHHSTDDILVYDYHLLQNISPTFKNKVAKLFY